MDRTNGDKCRILTMICLTAGCFLIEAFVGYVTNSIVLVADSFRMLTDHIALVISFIALSVSIR